MPTHIIHKQKVILNVSGLDNAFTYQNTVSNLFAGSLTTAIENLLNEIDTPNTITRIEKLTLDLGAINATHFDDEFKNKLLSQLRDSIHTTSNKQSGNSKVIKQSKSLRDSFLHFIKNGVLPWYIQAKTIVKFEAIIFNKWDATDWSFIVDWIRNNIDSYSQIIERLVWQFSSVFLKQVLATALKQTITDDTWRLLSKDLEYLNVKLNTNKNQTSKEYLIQIFNLVFYQDKPYALDTLITEELLSEFKNNGSELLVTHFNDVINNIQTSFVTTIIKNVYFFYQRQVSLKYITAKEILFTDENMLNNLLLKGDFKISSGVKELKSNTYKKSINKEENTINEGEILFIDNSGIILLHPFLQPYFEELSLIENKKFISDETQKRCVLLLHYLSTGLTEAAEFNLVLEKILCGYGLEESIPSIINLTQQEIDESNKLLEAIINYWPPLKNTSVEGLQKTFLQRSGKLAASETGWQLTIEQKTVDILLNKLPWGFSTIKLPWMKNMLNVDWC